MNLDHIKLFTLVVQQGSLSAASGKSGVAVATLSRKITELENQLNVQLLERSTQGVKPTLIGQQFAEQAALSLETLSDLAHRIQGNQTEFKGRLRLSIPQAFELWWDLIDAFQAAYPDIALHIVSSDRKQDLLADGIDVAVRVGSLQTDSLVAKKLFDIRLQLVASPAFIARYGTPATPDDLRNIPCAAWTPTADQDPKWQPGGKSCAITPQFASNDYHHLCHIISGGKALGDLPDFMATPLIAQGKLVEIFPEAPFPTMPVHLLYPSHRHPSSIVRAYIEFCGEWVKGRFAEK